MKLNKAHIKALVPGLLVLLASSCHFFSSKNGEDTGEPVARVYDRYLYKSDIESIVPEGLEANDSIAFVNNYINVWAKDQLILYKAEYNLTDRQKNFEEQINDYKNDLLKFAYQQEYVKQKLDTNISGEEIAEYYRNFSDNFVLSENILRVKYLVIPVDAPKAQDARQWFRSSRTADRKQLMQYALQYALEFSLEDTSWVSFDKIAAKIPVQTYNQQEFLENNRFVEETFNGKIYLLEIMDYKIKENTSPLLYVRDVIKNILINRKKLELLDNMEKSLLENAIQKQEFETFP